MPFWKGIPYARDISRGGQRSEPRTHHEILTPGGPILMDLGLPGMDGEKR